MRLETFIRKSLGMKAHTVVQVEEVADGGILAHVDRLPGRRLACEGCGRPFEPWQDPRHCTARCRRITYGRRHADVLREALKYLVREVRRLDNLVSGTRRRTKRGKTHDADSMDR